MSQLVETSLIPQMAIVYVVSLKHRLTIQDEESETILGEWMAERGNRDRLIVATKYTSE